MWQDEHQPSFQVEDAVGVIGGIPAGPAGVQPMSLHDSQRWSSYGVPWLRASAVERVHQGFQSQLLQIRFRVDERLNAS